MSTFAPLQFLKSAQNPLVWTAIDNGTDTRTSLIIYYGAVNTLPTDTDLYEVNCIMMHQAEKQLYANTGTSTTPSWEAFGPNSAFPQPLVPGSFLFTDGATVYWATQLVGQVQYNATNLNQYGILNFNSLLVASNDVPNSRINVDLDVVALGGDATFISTLEGNLDLANIGGTLDLATQVTGVLASTNIDITDLESTLDLSNIAGSIDLSTQVTGQLPLSNGGTGANLTDPNYDAVWVWDDTTNETRLAELVGLSYNSATNELTASGTPYSLDVQENGASVETGVDTINFTGNVNVTNPSPGVVDVEILSGADSEKKVGVGGITDTTWYNIQFPFIGAGSTSGAAYTIWSFSNLAAVASPSWVSVGAGEWVTTDSGNTSLLPDFSNGPFLFQSTKQLVAQWVAYVATSANKNCGMGFDAYAAGAGNNIFDTQGTNILGVGFIRSGSGAWAARTANGAGHTETAITVALDTAHTFRIEYDLGNATPQVRFYIDGTLVATNTTNLPTAVGSVLAFTAGNDGACTTVTRLGCPSFAVEI